MKIEPQTAVQNCDTVIKDNSFLNCNSNVRIRLFQYFVKRNRFIVPMHAAHIVTASHISFLCKFAFDSLFYLVLLGIVGMPMKMDCLISMSNIERNVVVAEYDATLCAIFELYTYIVVVLYSCEDIFNFRIVEKTVVVTLDKNDLTIKTSDEIFRIIVECLPDHIAKYVNQIALPMIERINIATFVPQGIPRVYLS